MAEAIVMRGISKRFGTRVVLEDLDLGVAQGAVFALLGPNGAGKTTVLNILSTLVRADAGTASVAGYDVAAEPGGVRRSISVTGQSAAVDEILTGAENLALMGRLSGLAPAAARRRAAELLERLDLTEAKGRRVRTFSGGMRRRLDLAISLLTVPPVVFLDEPTTGLDTRSRQELWAMVRELAAEGTTVLLTTQYLEEADHLADRVAVLDGGRVVVEGSAAELKSRVGREVLTFLDATGDVVQQLPTDGTSADIRRAIDTVDPGGSLRVALRAPSLDDVFLAVTSR